MSDNFLKVRKGVNLTPQAGEPLNGSDGDIYYDLSLNKFRGYKNGSWGDIGGGGGFGVNWIENFDAETNTDDYNLYNDGAVAVPTSGTGGIATNLTFTRTTTPGEILYQLASYNLNKAAFNCQGMGVSYDFTVSEGYRKSRQFVNFIYKTSGSFNFGSGTLVDPSDVGIFLFDIDTSQIVPMDTNYLDGSGKFLSGFSPVNTNSVNYRIIFHITSNNASAWSFISDQLIVGPQNFVSGQTVIQESATMTGFTSGGGGGFVLFSTVKEDSSKVLFTRTTVSGATRYTALKSIKASISANSNHSNQDQEHYIFVYNVSGTQILRMGWNSGGSLTDTVSGSLNMEPGDYAIYYTGASGLSNDTNTNFSFIATYAEPIRLSSTNTNVPKNAVVEKTANQGVTGAYSKITWDSVLTDRSSMFDNANDRIIIPETDFYDISALLTINHTAGNTISQMAIYINGVPFKETFFYFQGSLDDIPHHSISLPGIPLNANDYVEVFALTASNGTVQGGVSSNNFAVCKRANPQTLGSEGTDAITFKYATGGGPANLSTAYSAIPLNTTEGNSSFARLSGSQISIDPGRYLIIGYSQMSRIGGDGTTKCKLRRVSGVAADLAYGSPGYYANISRATAPSPIGGVVNISSQSTLEFMARANAVSSPLGVDPGYGDSNVFAFITFLRLG